MTHSQCGAVTITAHDANGSRLGEYDGDTGVLLREYLWLGDMPLAVLEGGQLYHLHTDHIDRPVMATDSFGAVVWAATYTPFGGIHQVSTNTGALTAQGLRFPGQWFQAETGLHQNWHRDYDSTLGRYLQVDPLGLVDGPSVYGYAGQSPVRFTDPKGLLKRPCVTGDFKCKNEQILEGGGGGGPSGGKPVDLWKLCKAGISALAVALGLKEEACAGDCDEECQLHHPRPRYLGGPRVQTLVLMKKSLHVGPGSLHGVMNAWMRDNCTKCDEDGNVRDAAHRRGNSGLDIMGVFTDDEVLACLARFYRTYYKLWPDVADAFFADYTGL